MIPERCVLRFLAFWVLMMLLAPGFAYALHEPGHGCFDPIFVQGDNRDAQELLEVRKAYDRFKNSKSRSTSQVKPGEKSGERKPDPLENKRAADIPRPTDSKVQGGAAPDRTKSQAKQ